MGLRFADAVQVGLADDDVHSRVRIAEEVNGNLAYSPVSEPMNTRFCREECICEYYRVHEMPAIRDPSQELKNGSV
ncbi:para-nitrophenol 4-monooxygenase [Aspergillus lentulus]|nr:para-nitrophenol 4-monooxygenase [Aspergillus lentulus]